MKKSIIVLVLLLLFGCSSQKKGDLSIVCPSGAPSIAFYNRPEFNSADASSIIPELRGNGGSDIIVIDTVNGLRALKEGSNYKLAANITFGNFYIASTGNDENGIMEDGDYIVLFSKGATPDLIFHYIYGNHYDTNIHYVNAVSDAAACLIKGINITDDKNKVDYVLIAEPALSMALKQNDEAKIIDNIQEKYAEKNNGLQMIQASIFVSNKIDKKEIKNFLNEIEKDINDLLEKPVLFKESVNNLSLEEVKEVYSVNDIDLVTEILDINSIGLGYKNAYENKEAIIKYASLFGIEDINDECFFK